MALTFWQEPKRRIDWPKAIVLIVLVFVWGWALHRNYARLTDLAFFLYFGIVFSSIRRKYNE